jgi:hypothetical protein
LTQIRSPLLSADRPSRNDLERPDTERVVFTRVSTWTGCGTPAVAPPATMVRRPAARITVEAI